jgi:hypothetical protein
VCDFFIDGVDASALFQLASDALSSGMNMTVTSTMADKLAVRPLERSSQVVRTPTVHVAD